MKKFISMVSLALLVQSPFVMADVPGENGQTSASVNYLSDVGYTLGLGGINSFGKDASSKEDKSMIATTSLQLGKDGDGKLILPRAKLKLEGALQGAWGFGVAGGAKFERDTAMDRKFDANARAAVTWGFSENDTHILIALGAEGGARSSEKYPALPYLQARLSGELGGCKKIGETKNQLCGDVRLDAAAGALQVELNAGAGLGLARKVASNGEKVYVRAGYDLSGAIDLDGTHHAEQLSLSAGARY